MSVWDHLYHGTSSATGDSSMRSQPTAPTPTPAAAVPPAAPAASRPERSSQPAGAAAFFNQPPVAAGRPTPEAQTRSPTLSASSAVPRPPAGGIGVLASGSSHPPANSSLSLYATPLAPSDSHVFVNGAYVAGNAFGLRVDRRAEDELSRSFCLTLHGFEVRKMIDEGFRPTKQQSISHHPVAVQQTLVDIGVIKAHELSKFRWFVSASRELLVLCFDTPETATEILARYWTARSNGTKMRLQLDRCLARGHRPQWRPTSVADRISIAEPSSSTDSRQHQPQHQTRHLWSGVTETAPRSSFASIDGTGVRYAAPEQFLAKLHVSSGAFEHTPNPVVTWCQDQEQLKRRLVPEVTPLVNIPLPDLLIPSSLQEYFQRLLGIWSATPAMPASIDWLAIDRSFKVTIQLRPDSTPLALMPMSRRLGLGLVTVMSEVATDFAAFGSKLCKEHFGLLVDSQGRFKQCRFGGHCRFSHDAAEYTRTLKRQMAKDGAVLAEGVAVEREARRRDSRSRSRSRSREREWRQPEHQAAAAADGQLPQPSMYAHSKSHHDVHPPLHEIPPMHSFDQIHGMLSLPQQLFRESRSAESSNSEELLARMVYTDGDTPSEEVLGTAEGRAQDLRRVLALTMEGGRFGQASPSIQWIARRWSREGRPTNEILIQLDPSTATIAIDQLRRRLNRGSHRPALLWIESFILRHRRLVQSAAICPQFWRLRHGRGGLTHDCQQPLDCLMSHDPSHLAELFARVAEQETSATGPCDVRENAHPPQLMSMEEAGQVAAPIAMPTGTDILELPDLFGDREPAAAAQSTPVALESAVDPHPYAPCYLLHSVVFAPDLNPAQCILVDWSPAQEFPPYAIDHLTQFVPTGSLFKKEFRDEWTSQGTLSSASRRADALHCISELRRRGRVTPAMDLRMVFRRGPPEASKLQLHFATETGRELFVRTWNNAAAGQAAEAGQTTRAPKTGNELTEEATPIDHHQQHQHQYQQQHQYQHQHQLLLSPSSSLPQSVPLHGAPAAAPGPTVPRRFCTHCGCPQATPEARFCSQCGHPHVPL